MPKPYRFERSVTNLLRSRNAQSGFASQVVNLELVDFTEITDIRSVRPPVTPPGKGKFPKMNGKEKLVANLSLNFFLNAQNINRLKRSKGKDISVLSVVLVNAVKPNLLIPISTVGLNFDQLLKGRTSGYVPVSINMEIDFDDVDTAVRKKNKTGPSPRMSRNLKFLFTLLTAGNGGDLAGNVIPYSTHLVDYDIENDLQVYYTVRNPVTITAASTAFDQSLITLRKPANCNAEMVDVYRRRLSRDGTGGAEWMRVKRVDFAGDTDTLPGENCLEMIVDGNPTINPRQNIPPIDNVFAHQYRAIPVGKRNAPALVFRDAFTVPISQADVSIGDNFRVLPILDGPPGQKSVRGYALTDDNFLSPNELMIDQTSGIAVVTYGGSETTPGVTVSALGVTDAVAIDFVRRDLTRSEKRFTVIKTVRGNASRLIVRKTAAGLSLDTSSIIHTFFDDTALDGHTYEYAIRSYGENGVTQISEDTSLTTYRDPRILPTQGISLSEVSEPTVTEANHVEIEFAINVPQNVTSLLAALLNIRAGQGKESPFAADIIAQRQSLSPQPIPVVRRLNLTTGEEASFKLMGNTAEKFESLDSEEGSGIRNLFRFKFTDDGIIEGNQYQYEILVNLREPLSVTDEITSVVPKSRQPYMFQSCKIFNPLFTSRGILPPTARGEDFIRQKNIETGRDRLLNRFSADDSYDLGITAARQLTPQGSTVLISSAGEAISSPSVQTTRSGGSTVSWSVRGGTSNIDYFKVFAEDTFVDNTGLRMTKRSFIAGIAAQGEQRFNVESKLHRLIEADREQFIDQAAVTIDMVDLQRFVDRHEFSIERVYEIRSIKLNGDEGSVIRSDAVKVWQGTAGYRERRGFLDEGPIFFSISPSIVFESIGPKARYKGPTPKQQQEEEQMIQEAPPEEDRDVRAGKIGGQQNNQPGEEQQRNFGEDLLNNQNNGKQGGKQNANERGRAKAGNMGMDFM